MHVESLVLELCVVSSFKKKHKHGHQIPDFRFASQQTEKRNTEHVVFIHHSLRPSTRFCQFRADFTDPHVRVPQCLLKRMWPITPKNRHKHTHTHVNTYPPTRLYTHLHIKDALMCTQRCAHLHTCKHVHTNICTRKHAYMHTHADTSKFACTNMYKHIVTHMHTCTCTPTHIRARVKDVMLLMCECLNEQ